MKRSEPLSALDRECIALYWETQNFAWVSRLTGAKVAYVKELIRQYEQLIKHNLGVGDFAIRFEIHTLLQRDGILKDKSY